MIKPITICLIIFIQSFGYADGLYKNVNGERIKLTQQEETKTRQKWAVEDEKQILESVGRNMSRDIDKKVVSDRILLLKVCSMLLEIRSQGISLGEHEDILDEIEAIRSRHTISGVVE